jgi:hypothetical protein
MRHFLESLRLFRTQSSLIPYLWKPICLAFCLYVGLVIAAASAVGGIFGAQIQESVFRPLTTLAGAALVVVVAVFLGGPILTGLATLVSSWHWDGLGRKVEAIKGVTVDGEGLKPSQLALDIALRLMFGLAGLVFIIVFTFTGLWWASSLVAGFLALMDYTAGACQRRSRIFPASAIFVLGRKGALQLWLVCSASALVPLLFVLLHPVLAGAGTLLILGGDRASDRVKGSEEAL